MDSSEQDTNNRRPEYSLSLRSAADMEAALKKYFDVDVAELTAAYGGQTREIIEIYMAASSFAFVHALQPVKVGWLRRRSAESLILRAMVPEDQHKRLGKLTLQLGGQLLGG